MKLLIFLQNAYDAKLDYVPDLFAEPLCSHQSGIRLKEILPNKGEEVYVRNCTPEVGTGSSSSLAPSYPYMHEQIDEIKPDVIVACGCTAKMAMQAMGAKVPVIKMSHPAYRALTKITTSAIRVQLEQLL